MKTNRSLLVLILLSVITFGIYPLFFWHGFSRDMNVACYGDGKHTRGILARFFFSLLTFGIYDLVWMYGVGNRIALNCQRKGMPCTTSGGSILAWYILGSLIIVGPFVTMHKMISGLNDLCAIHNANYLHNGGYGGGSIGGGNIGGKTININVNA